MHNLDLKVKITFQRSLADERLSAADEQALRSHALTVHRSDVTLQVITSVRGVAAQRAAERTRMRSGPCDDVTVKRIF